jgi:hypothetical protein
MGSTRRCIWICNSEEVSVNEWVAVAVGASTLITTGFMGLRWVIRQYLAELKPNSGTSMKDQLTRLEQRVDDLFVLISKR